MKNIKSIILLAFICLSNSIYAQWVSLNIVGGLAISVVKTDSAYFLLNRNGIYKSELSKVQWTKINSTYINSKISFVTGDIELVEHDNKLLLFNKLSGNKCMLLSNDNGKNWINILNDPNLYLSNYYIKSNQLYFTYLNNKPSLADSTTIFKLNNNSLQSIKTFKDKIKVYNINDTLYFHKKVGFFNSYATTTDLENFQQLPIDSIFSALSLIHKHKGLYISVNSDNGLFTSRDFKNWTFITRFSTSFTGGTFKMLDSVIFASTRDDMAIIRLDTISVKKYKHHIPNFIRLDKRGNEYLFSSYDGFFRVKNDSLYFEMNGIGEAEVQHLKTFGNKLFGVIRDSVFYSVDLGVTWKFHPNITSSFLRNDFYRMGSKYVSVSLNKVYVSVDSGLNWTTGSLPDSTTKYVIYSGNAFNEYYFKGTFTNKPDKYYKSSDGLNFMELDLSTMSGTFYPSYFFQSADTLFVIGNKLNNLAYSVNNGLTWSSKSAMIKDGFKYYPTKIEYVQNIPVVYGLSLNTADPDKMVAYVGNNWKVLDMGVIHYSEPIMFVNNHEFYFVANKNQLLYSTDGLNTLKTSSIRLNFNNGFSSTSIAMLGRTIFVNLESSGLWKNNISSYLGIENELSAVLPVFPNPSNGLIHIPMGGNTTFSTINIYTINGVKIRTYLPNEVNIKDNYTKLDLNELSNGLYFIQLNGDLFSAQYKVSIRK